MSIEFDTSELRTFAARLSQVGPEAQKMVRPVIERGANNIKRQLRVEMGRSQSFGPLAGSIDYDIHEAGGVVEAEIGPGKRYRGGRSTYGKGANIAYFGTSRGGGTVPDPEGALLAEAPNVMEWLAKAAEGSL